MSSLLAEALSPSLPSSSAVMSAFAPSLSVSDFESMARFSAESVIMAS
eukprot:CAMPEP_0183499954 /NCGR_PEP_ID=MMETSP0371-20130417/2157_1 /TAXON_ID=268820 /ORGANISM="Peridinium aciculiferum, Strain PAER-2" /LENGTH=47 /DNA_ID= /DNA_START= /DNA_END= /DNA_ORIENTATION=